MFHTCIHLDAKDTIMKHFKCHNMFMLSRLFMIRSPIQENKRRKMKK